MEKKLQTPSQTVGPYFAYGLTPQQYAYEFEGWVDGDMVEDVLAEDVITVTGRVFDGNGDAISDAMLEIWQKDGEKEAFGRFGTGTDPANRFIFRTTKPQPYPGHAPFLSVIVFMRGQLIHAYTRIYFSDEAKLNAQDPVLQTVPEHRKSTLIAQQTGKVYELNIYMQGDKETVFFDV